MGENLQTENKYRAFHYFVCLVYSSVSNTLQRIILVAVQYPL